MADFKLTTRPRAVISYGMLQQKSEKEIQDWLKYNMKKFLLDKMHVQIEPYDKDIDMFCENIYTEIHDVGYTEGDESARFDLSECF